MRREHRIRRLFVPVCLGLALSRQGGEAAFVFDFALPPNALMLGYLDTALL